MSPTVPIIYCGFYDIPLAFVAWHRGKQFLFLRDFDDALDDYPQFYRVFTLPNLSEDAVKKSWVQIETLADQFVGEVPVAEVDFDQTRRMHIGAGILDELSEKLHAKRND